MPTDLETDPRYGLLTEAGKRELRRRMLEERGSSVAASKAPAMRAQYMMPRPIPQAAQNIAMLNATLQQIKDMRQKLVQLGPDAWNRSKGQHRNIAGVETAGAPTRLWEAFARKHGMSIAGQNPQVDELNRMMGALTTQHATTTAALMKSSGTRAYQFARDVQGHLPDPAADYTVNMNNLNYLLSDVGPYQSNIQFLSGHKPQSIPSATPTPTPPSVGDVGSGALKDVPGLPGVKFDPATGKYFGGF